MSYSKDTIMSYSKDTMSYSKETMLIAICH